MESRSWAPRLWKAFVQRALHSCSWDRVCSCILADRALTFDMGKAVPIGCLKHNLPSSGLSGKNMANKLGVFWKLLGHFSQTLFTIWDSLLCLKGLRFPFSPLKIPNQSSPPLPRGWLSPSKLPKYRYLQWSRLCPGVIFSFKVTKVLLFQWSRRCPAGIFAFKVTKVVSLFTVITLLPRGVFSLSKLPKYRYLRWYHLCPGGIFPFKGTKVTLFAVIPLLPRGYFRFQSYQSNAIYNDPACAQWVFSPSKFPKYFYLQWSRLCPGGIFAFKVTQVSLFTVIPLLPREYFRFQSYQSIVIYNDPASAQRYVRLQS